ncbi:hypothetical protein RAA17_11245 [Komagataeibacter rhaeticus]|nr:hypothetical protein [Komagataeibacter rhaeticus]
MDMQIRETGLDLPPGYYARLPKLATGPFAGLPRVFGVAWALVAHTDSSFQPDTLCSFLLAYQSVTPLTIGELWAVPITLRIVLIENLRRVVAAIMDNNTSRREADTLADRLDAYRRGTPAALSGFLAMIDPRILTCAFTAQLAHRSRGLDPERTPPLSGWNSAWPTGAQRWKTQCATTCMNRVPSTPPSATSSPACG